MVLVVEDIEEVAVERVDVFDFGEVLEHVGDFFIEGLLAELDFAHVKGSDSADGIARMYDGGCFSLGFWENNVDEVCSWGDYLDGFEIVAHFCSMLKIVFL